MADGTPKAIELKGIVHSETKIGVEDGMCEDLVNLRFKDGSWRSTGDGKHVFSLSNDASGVMYEQLFIHTNVYRHLLGVDPSDNCLYWFANLTAKEDSADIGKELFEFTALESRVLICKVEGSLYIMQTGHLLTIIDHPETALNEDNSYDTFEYYVYKKKDYGYVKVLTSQDEETPNGRNIYPFEGIHFNLTTIDYNNKGNRDIYWGAVGGDVNISSNGTVTTSATINECNNVMVDLMDEVTKKNKFLKPFLLVAAIELYDGTYSFATNPIYLCPYEKPSSNKPYLGTKDTETDVDKIGWSLTRLGNYVFPDEVGQTGSTIGLRDIPLKVTSGYRIAPLDSSNFSGAVASIGCAASAATNDTGAYSAATSLYCSAASANLIMSVGSCDIIKNNRDIFNGVSIFITPQAQVFEYETATVTENTGQFVSRKETRSGSYTLDGNTYDGTWYATSFTYVPKRLKDSDIIDQLVRSNFFLLKSFTIDEFCEFIDNPFVNLSALIDDGVLSNIVQQDRLSIESTDRYTYVPKVQCNYNGRLHIANYKRYPYYGYPIDSFMLNNHLLHKDTTGGYFKGVLKGLSGAGSQPSFYSIFYDDSTSQWQAASDIAFPNYSDLISAGAPIASISVDIDTSENVLSVSKYIEAYDTSVAESGRIDFFEALSALLTFPDNRANKMTIYVVTTPPSGTTGKPYAVKSKEFTLKSSNILNVSYCFNEDLKPFDINDFDYITDALGNVVTYTAEELKELMIESKNVGEDFYNGLKVSATDNPLSMPVENTYQIGSSEIIAMCSNSVAVGTGQTGTAPLYVFCKDGVYALMVDADGEMAYTNARIIARDVCNNARSVTPIDTGVVFTTDRGLMCIAGEQVEEIGEPVEGDWCKFNDQTSVDYNKIASNAYTLTKLGNLPTDSISADEFLAYLKNSIVNYNHNDRELMVSNTLRLNDGSPVYNYTYVMDRNGQWSRRDYSADEYVNNYPTSYRVIGGEFYQVDKESDMNNGIFAMSHVIKLDSIGYKELHRLVARGYFETTRTQTVSAFRSSTFTLYDIDNLSTLGRLKAPFTLKLHADTTSSGERTYKFTYLDGSYKNVHCEDGEYDSEVLIESNVKSIVVTYTVTPSTSTYITLSVEGDYLGLYVFGSYDGRRWVCLGHREKTGKFTDIGTVVERTDCRFFRFVLAGQVSADSRLDYFEASEKGSPLGTKIR